MIIYISMLLVVLACYIIQSQMNRTGTVVSAGQLPTSKVLAFVLFAYIVFWAGIRNGVADTYAYISDFNATTTADLGELDFTFGEGWGFDIIRILFKQFVSSNYHVWLMFVAIICGACVGLTFYRYSSNFYYSVFLFLSSTTFTWMLNGMRQFLAACILFACTPLLVKRKAIIYCVVVLLCATIHASCVIMIPIYFIVQGKPWKAKCMISILAVALVLMFTSTFTGIMDAVLEDTSYANTTQVYAADDGAHPLRVLLHSVPVIIALLGRRVIARKDHTVHVFVNMSIITLELYLVAMVTSGIMMGRLPIYTSLYGLIQLPYLIENCFTKNSRKYVYAISIPLYLLYFHLMMQGYYYSSDFTGVIH